MRRIRLGSCARAASGHATAEPPANEMKSRRLMCPQIEGPNLAYRRGAETVLCNTAKSGGRGSGSGLGRVKTRIENLLRLRCDLGKLRPVRTGIQ